MDNLSAQGRALLKSMGGSPLMAKATPMAMARWGLDRPESVLHVVPESLAALCVQLPDAYLRKTDSALEQEGCVTRLDRRIRLRFWDEYEKAHTESRPMGMNDLVAATGVSSWSIYHDRLKESPALLAWLMNPPAEYKLQMREAHELGLRRLTDILELDLIDPVTKKVNPSIGVLILQAIKLIDNRLHGAPTTKNVNVNVDTGKPPEGATGLSMDEVDKKILELEARLSGPAGAHAVPGSASPARSPGALPPPIPGAQPPESGRPGDSRLSRTRGEDFLEAEFEDRGSE